MNEYPCSTHFALKSIYGKKKKKNLNGLWVTIAVQVKVTEVYLT